MELYIVLGYLGELCLLINLILYLKALPNQSKAFKLFILFLFLTFLVQILSTFYARVLKTNNLFISNVFLFVQFSVLSFFYEKLIKRRLIIYIYGIIIILLIGQYLMDFDLLMMYNPFGISLTQSILIVYSIIYFYKSLNKKKPEFLIVNIGVFTYLICSTLLFSSGNLVFNLNIPKETYLLLLKLNAFLYTVFQILIFIEWRKNYYKKIHR